jgi:hypothetical protein
VDRNDKILSWSLFGALLAVVLVAYAPSAIPSNSLPERLWSIASSGFVIALIGSLAGAFAGALGAQIIFEKTARRKSLLAEITATNFATATCHGVVNAYLSFKKQIIADVCAGYWRDRERFLHAAKTGEVLIGPGSGFKLDFRVFEAPFSPIESLQQELQERVRPDGAPLAFFTLLREGMHTLDKALAARTELVARFREIPLERITEQYKTYFSIAPDNSIIDGTYPFQMKIIEELTDDCIGIGIVLCDLLEKHGHKLGKKYGIDAPKIVHVIAWSEDDPDLVPDLTRYQDWLKKAFIGLH